MLKNRLFLGEEREPVATATAAEDNSLLISLLFRPFSFSAPVSENNLHIKSKMNLLHHCHGMRAHSHTEDEWPAAAGAASFSLREEQQKDGDLKETAAVTLVHYHQSPYLKCIVTLCIV